ncbi:MAG: hypothetical protein RLP15_08435 [Cryomorphaceae bacterium]
MIWIGHRVGSVIRTERRKLGAQRTNGSKLLTIPEILCAERESVNEVFKANAFASTGALTMDEKCTFLEDRQKNW